ncbi:MAG TPA: hypothetical protein PLL10_04420, partial [Elusimicrobiales bacterium]|nr:hypothetical protein [Elusimicrobiales bacterium]
AFMAEEIKDDGLPSLNLKAGSEKKTETSKSGGLLARVPKVTPSASPQTGLLGRFRGMAKKDMGLMAAAGALMAALPLAENFMMKPSDGPGKSGKAGELFEPNGTVSYGAPGMGDAITPLTARDPLSLILAGGDDEPKAVAAAPEENTGGGRGGASDGFRESVREPFRRATERARAAVTTPKSISFRGMPSIGGGGGSTSGAGIDAAAKSAPNAPAHRGSSGAYAPGLRGFGRSVGGGGVEGLKGQSDNIASRMNRGSAIQALSGLGGEFGGGDGGSNLARPSAPDQNNQNSESEDKYKLQPPKPKKPKEPGGGGGLQPWFKEMKEMEAAGEIKRAAQQRAFEHQAKMELDAWLRESAMAALNTALVDPLKKYLAAKFGEGGASSGETPVSQPPNVSTGDEEKKAYESVYDTASKAVEDCTKTPADNGVVSGACLKANDALQEAADKLAKAKGKYEESYNTLAQELTALTQKFAAMQADYTSAKAGRTADLTGASAILSAIEPRTQAIESYCAGSNGKRSSGCKVYKALDVASLKKGIGALQSYETDLGKVYADATEVEKSMTSAKDEIGTNLSDAGSTIGAVKTQLGSMSSLLPTDYAQQMESQMKTLGQYKKPEDGSAYKLVNKASGSEQSEKDENQYWETVKPYDWLNQSLGSLKDPSQGMPSFVPQTYQDEKSRPPSIYRLGAMITNSSRLPDALKAVSDKMTTQVAAHKTWATKVADDYQTTDIKLIP